MIGSPSTGSASAGYVTGSHSSNHACSSSRLVVAMMKHWPKASCNSTRGIVGPPLPQLAEPGAIPQPQQPASRRLIPVYNLLDAPENTEHLTDIRLDMLEGGGLVIRFRVHNGYDIPLSTGSDRLLRRQGENQSSAERGPRLVTTGAPSPGPEDRKGDAWGGFPAGRG